MHLWASLMAGIEGAIHAIQDGMDECQEEVASRTAKIVETTTLMKDGAGSGRTTNNRRIEEDMEENGVRHGEENIVGLYTQ